MRMLLVYDFGVVSRGTAPTSPGPIPAWLPSSMSIVIRPERK